jgi:hypothetical protein
MRAFMGVMLLLACDDKTADVSTRMEALVESGPFTSVEADYLARTYESNPIAADDLYKGKALRLSGTVTTVTTDPNGTPIVGLGDGGNRNYVVCVWGKHRTDAKHLRKGSKTRLLGVGAGLLENRIVTLGFCRLDA